ncbi:hypothetical protein GCM10010195_53650 [Kitasatospora griseola]|nr:helix-turn-helix domain-containing protein [Kitasatospora griseola]GGQ91069.1 hypothetical protein GCM10010195_53650 [Kitasatospora griseola]
MAEPVCVRRLTDQEGQRLQQNLRRGSASSVRFRRAMMLLASAGGNRVPVLVQLVQADEDTIQGVIHRSNEIGLSGLDPRTPVGSKKLRLTQRELTGRLVCFKPVAPWVQLKREGAQSAVGLRP